MVCIEVCEVRTAGAANHFPGADRKKRNKAEVAKPAEFHDTKATGTVRNQATHIVGQDLCTPGRHLLRAVGSKHKKYHFAAAAFFVRFCFRFYDEQKMVSDALSNHTIVIGSNGTACTTGGCLCASSNKNGGVER